MPMKPLIPKVLVVLLVGLGLWVGWIVVFRPQEPDLATLNCQAQDLGDLYHPSGRPAQLTRPFLVLGETVVASHTVELVDMQLTYTVLECTIVRYENAAAAQRAFAQVCTEQSEPAPVEVGAAACQFTGPAPRNLAFQRDAYVVIMSGDVTYFPAQELDKRWVFGISGG